MKLTNYNCLVNLRRGHATPACAAKSCPSSGSGIFAPADATCGVITGHTTPACAAKSSPSSGTVVRPVAFELPGVLATSGGLARPAFGVISGAWLN